MMMDEVKGILREAREALEKESQRLSGSGEEKEVRGPPAGPGYFEGGPPAEEDVKRRQEEQLELGKHGAFGVADGLFGTPPKRTACPANANGYGQHETDAEVGFVAVRSKGGGPLWIAVPCKHCGSVFGKRV